MAAVHQQQSMVPSIHIDKVQDIPCSGNGLSSVILSELSLEHYIPLFQQENIDLDSFLNLRKDQFISLGIKDPGDLWLLLNCSKQLKYHIQTKNRYSICESILEEDDEDQEEDDFYSLKSNQSTQNTSTSSSSSSEVISKVIHAYESFNKSPRQPLLNLLAPPGTVIPRNTNKLARPLSMPVQLPSAMSPPPDYHTELLFGKRLDKSKSMIFPREEEGKEELPAYSCSVYKMGYVHIKKECDAPNVKSKWRTWRKLYVELWGTLLKIYRCAPLTTKSKHKLDRESYRRWSLKLPFYYYYNYYYTPIYTISLAGAEATRAFDYSRRPNVLRLSTQQGPQFLMRLSSHIEMVSWIEHLQAAINISLDLEFRPMPKFITIPTRGLNATVLDARTIELERAREQRRRDQREILI